MIRAELARAFVHFERYKLVSLARALIVQLSSIESRIIPDRRTTNCWQAPSKKLN